MKKLLLICTAALLFSCSADDKIVTDVEVNLVVDHYRTTSVFYGTAFIVAEDGDPQAFEIPRISGFEFQPGNRYQITATRRTVKNDGTNATTDSYNLLAVQSMDTIPPDTRFRMPLAKFVNGVGYVRWVVGNAETGYVVSNEIPLDCANFCTELYSRLAIEENITGEFEHGPNGTYVLKALN